MNLVVVGLAPREEAVFGFFLGRFMPSWSWKSAAADRDAVLPQSDLLVVDLVAMGLGRGSEAAAAELLRRLQGTPAVLLVPAHDSTWSAMAAEPLTPHSLVWLAKPYDTKAMQAALEKAQALVRQTAHATALPPVVAPPMPAPVAAPMRTEEAPGLSATELQARLAQLSEPGRYVFLRKLSEMLSLDHPFEARFTVHNSLIVHPANGWFATNTPMLVIQRVCQSDALASAVTIREIDGLEAEERAQRLGMPPRELDVFLLELVAATLDAQPPRPAPAQPH